MQIEKPDVILAHLVQDSGESETEVKPTVISPEPTVKMATLDEMVESIMNPDAKGVKELLSRVTQMAGDITDTILNESKSSVVKEDTLLAQPIVLNPENDKRFIQKVINFLAGREFDDQCKVAGEKYNLPPKVVAKNFCLRILGTIGDVLGICINVTRNFVKGTIQLLISILFGGVDLICNVAQGLLSVITLNQTAQPTAKK